MESVPPRADTEQPLLEPPPDGVTGEVPEAPVPFEDTPEAGPVVPLLEPPEATIVPELSPVPVPELLPVTALPALPMAPLVPLTPLPDEVVAPLVAPLADPLAEPLGPIDASSLPPDAAP